MPTFSCLVVPKKRYIIIWSLCKWKQSNKSIIFAVNNFINHFLFANLHQIVLPVPKTVWMMDIVTVISPTLFFLAQVKISNWAHAPFRKLFTENIEQGSWEIHDFLLGSVVPAIAYIQSMPTTAFVAWQEVNIYSILHRWAVVLIS